MSNLIQNIPISCVALHKTVNSMRGVAKRVLADLVDAIERANNLDFADVSTQDNCLITHISNLRFDAEILYPSPKQFFATSHSNTTSAVVRVACNGSSALFCGDLDREGWERFLTQTEQPEQLQSDVFKFPHHGGNLIHAYDRIDNTGTRAREYAENILAHVQPKVTCISTAQRDNWEHPNSEVLAALRTQSSLSSHRILCTGVTRLCDNNFGLRRSQVISLLPPVNKSSRVLLGQGCPCAGNILIDLNDDGSITVRPSVAVHLPIVGLYDNRQCLL